MGLAEFQSSVRRLDTKHSQHFGQEWKFPVTEVQSLYQLRISVHFASIRARDLVSAIDKVGWVDGHYKPRVTEPTKAAKAKSAKKKPPPRLEAGDDDDY